MAATASSHPLPSPLALALYAASTVLGVCGLAASILAIYRIGRARKFNAVFRCGLTLTLWPRIPLVLFDRTMLYYARIWTAGVRPNEPVFTMLYRLAFAIVGSATLVMALDRIASACAPRYARLSRSSVACLLLTPLLMILPGACIVILVLYDVLPLIVLTYFTMFPPMIAGAVTALSHQLARSAFARRHALRLGLERKMQSLRTMEAAEIYFPCVINEAACSAVAYIILIHWMPAVKDAEMATTLGHVYELMTTLRVFGAPLLMLCCMRRLRRRLGERAARQRRRVPNAADVYFEAYKW